MIKVLALAGVLTSALAVAALAQQPANTDECLKSAFELAQAAEDKKLPAAEAKKVDGLLEKMEGHCDAKQFPEAAAVAADVKKSVGAK